MHKVLGAGVISTGILILGTTAHGAATAEQRCQAAKNKAAGKYALCRQKAEQRLVLTSDAARYTEGITRCEDKFAQAWQRAIDQATGAGASTIGN